MGWLTRLIDILPDWLRSFLARRIEEGFGVALVAASLFGLIAMASWSGTDPSLNNATGLEPKNWMGLPGAYAADILLQALGLGGVVFLAVPLIWGIRAFSHASPDKIVFRVAAWLAATFMATAFLSSLFRPFFWPLAIGLGGVVGDALAALGLSLFAPLLGPTSAYGLNVLITAPLTAALVVFAGHITLADMRELMARLRRDSDDTDDVHDEPYQPVRRRLRASLIDEDEPDISDDLLADRPDLLPSRLRLAYWAVTDTLSYWHDRLLRRGDFAPLSPDEVAAARAGEFGNFGRRRDGETTPTPRKRARAARPAIEREERIEPVLSARGSARVERKTTRAPKPSKRAAAEAQPRLALEPASEYQLPPLSLLTKPKAVATAQLTDDALEQNARLLESVLDDFGIRGEIIHVRPGPVVTLYELEPAAGIKSSRVISLADDIARSMSAVSARVAVVPGRNVIGIELPNVRREMVYLRELLETGEYESSSSKLALALGKNIGGEPVISDLSRMPHLLIAGTTGSGKSVGINTMILSLLYRLSPEQCKLIMIDPKMLELSVYDGIPHLLSPVVTEPKKAVVALKWVVKEMEDRYRKMSKVGVRNIEGYNSRVIEANAKGEVLVRTVQTGFDKETGKAIYEEEEMDLSPMPFIVVIVDEMADLMMVAGKEIEAAVQRLAQMARAAGIHIITATQRPSVDVITGTIKANFPTRISFQVTSKIDSRTILGEQGAEQLLGQGDMLYMAGGGRIRRVHGPFVSDEEVEKVVTFLKKQGTPEYLEAITAEAEETGEDPFGLSGGGSGDDLYDKAVAIVARDKRASTSYIQRRLQIGYNRAARLIEMMEDQGVVSPPNHQGKREVLVGDH
ncbi:MAG: cell division protein FtsK [Rhizobiales bacterium]|nr:cell division protein FtsK [Hyphomicrobiales bacterium]